MFSGIVVYVGSKTERKSAWFIRSAQMSLSMDMVCSLVIEVLRVSPRWHNRQISSGRDNRISRRRWPLNLNKWIAASAIVTRLSEIYFVIGRGLGIGRFPVPPRVRSSAG